MITKTNTPICANKQFKEILNNNLVSLLELRKLEKLHDGSYLSYYIAVQHIPIASCPDLENAMNHLGVYFSWPLLV